MRRIAMAFMTTVSSLVLLFSYHTSRNEASATAAPGPSTDAAANDQAATTDSATADSATTDSTAQSGEDSTQDSQSQSSQDSSSSSSGSTSSGSTSSGSTSSGSTAAKTYAGDVVQTRWGPVQVQITVSGGKITKSEVLQVPWNNGHDMQINSYAVPILNSEVVQAQSAGIDAISGATVTSDGYVQSLQSAIDAAGL